MTDIFTHHPISGKLLTKEEDAIPMIGSWDYYWTKGDICGHTWWAVIEDRCCDKIECPFCGHLQPFKIWRG